MPTTEEWQNIAAEQIAVSDAIPAACEILAVCASTRDCGFLGIAEALGYYDEPEGELARDLARRAWDIAANRLGWQAFAADWDVYWMICAEAEALLQTGEYVLYE